MSSTDAYNPSAFVAALERFTIYSPEHKKFASRNGGNAIRVSKSAADQYCHMQLIEHVSGTNKIRFSLDTGNVVFRHTDNGNLHSRSGEKTKSDTLFELIPRTDGTFHIKADDGLYVSVYDSSGLVLRSSKKVPDVHCIFEIEIVTA